MENKTYTAADNVGGPASLLRRILTYSLYGMSVSVVVQLLLATQWIGRADALARGWPLLLAVSTGFLFLLLFARRLAYQNQEHRAITVLFVSLCAISVLVVIALPSALGLALVAPAFGLIIALPYVNRALFWRMGIGSIMLSFLLVPVSAILGPMRPAPDSLEIVAQALPLVVASTIVVVLISQMHVWLAATMRELRESRATLESKVIERTEALQIANKALTAEITQRILVEQHLSTQASYLSALHELSLGVINCLDSRTMMDAIVTRTCQLMNTPHAFIGLLDEAGEHVSISVARGSFADMLAQAGPMLPTLIGSVGKSDFGGKPLIIEDYKNWPHQLDVVPAGLKACAIYPLQIHENKVAGVLVVAYSEPGRIFDSGKCEVLARLAELASIAYSNVLLYEAVRQNEHALEMRVAERTRELSTLLGVAQNLSGTLNLPLLLKRVSTIGSTGRLRRRHHL